MKAACGPRSMTHSPAAVGAVRRRGQRRRARMALTRRRKISLRIAFKCGKEHQGEADLAITSSGQRMLGSTVEVKSVEG